MILFNSNNFENPDVDYLRFDTNFSVEVNTDKIKIILGPNGIGKSSIYRNIQARHPEYSYIDYDKVEEAVLKSKNSIIVASKISKIEEKTNELESIKNAIGIKDSFSYFNLGNATKRAKQFKGLKGDQINLITEFDDEKLEGFFELGNNLSPFIVKYGKDLIDQVQEELKIEEIRDSYKKKYLNLIDNYLLDDEHICPVCNTKFDVPIKDKIKESLSKIQESSNKIVNDYIAENPNERPTEVFNNITKLKNVIANNKITIKDLENFIICGGNRETAQYIKNNKERIISLNIEIKSLKSEKEKFYKNIKNIEDRIRSIFEGQLKIPREFIIFDDENSELIIKLTISISNYSTGEINLITFIVTLLSFINSDQDTIIIDDPLSSYDIPNQYKIMYEITKANSNKNFHILILTHNIDCVNIANSQDKKSYSMELMDKIDGTVYLNPISRLGDNGFQIEYLLKQLEDRNDYKYTEYLKLLSKKDELDRNNQIHQLFHYDDFYETSNGLCSNEELVEIIENIDKSKLKNNDSVINSANKILYLAALRVWIEKQLYDNTDDKEGLKEKKYLAAKISFILDENHWTGSKKISKEFLMSKKVLLNQNDHATSQKEPFYYALSISMDEIQNELVEIKNHFKS